MKQTKRARKFESPKISNCTTLQMIVCLALVGKSDFPLFLRTYTDKDEGVRFHQLVHTSLDVVQETKAGA
jgi:hypothetical protein